MPSALTAFRFGLAGSLASFVPESPYAAGKRACRHGNLMRTRSRQRKAKLARAGQRVR